MIFLKVGGHDPSDDLLKHFADLQPPVRRGSEAGHAKDGSVADRKTGAAGLILSLGDIRWNSSADVEVRVSYHHSDLAAAGYRYSLAKHGGRWRVTWSGVSWMS